MSSKASPVRRKHRSPKVRTKNYSLWITQLLVIFSCAFIAYLLWLDYEIRQAFEGKKWALPARVYASPGEIYPGQRLSLTGLQRELSAIGYSQDKQLNQPGEYRLDRTSLDLVKRAFTFWDGDEAEQTVRVIFDNGHVIGIRDLATAKPVSVLRLEPQLIGRIYPRHNEDRVLISHDQIQPVLIEALIAVEDRNFFSHPGLDFRGILRALLTNILRGKISQGGSTLTQQLVKNFFLTPERTIGRKLNEMIMALLLETRYDKQDILTAYINEVYLGQHGARAIHGFGTAAEFYFGKPLHELRLDQVALLVGLVRGASYYNPRKHQQRALDRRNLVLDLMFEEGYLTRGEKIAAINEPLDITAKQAWTSAKYPAFLDLVRRQLLRDYKMEDLQNEGLRIFTTLEPVIQENAERSARKKISVLEQEKSLPAGKIEMAIVILRIGTGEVIAVIGGRGDYTEGFNRALDAKRPIGSLVKPAIYLSALSVPEKYNLLTKVTDEAVSIRQGDGTFWEPRNFDRKTHDDVSLQDALKYSYNLASTRLGLDIGLDRVIETIRRLGVEGQIPAYPSLLLGAVELTPLDVSQMYQTIANGGFQVPLNSIREVLDSNGQPLQRYGLEIKQSENAAVMYLINYLLSEVVNGGTARSLQTIMPDSLPLAGKTGTTNDLRDSWFAGYGDNLLTVTWMGYDDNQPSKFTGATGALPLWATVMQAIRIQPLELVVPEEIEWLKAKPRLFARNCPNINVVPYIKDHKPEYRENCIVH